MPQSDNSEALVRLRPMKSDDVTILTSLWIASWQEALQDIDFSARADWLAGFLHAPGHATLVAELSDMRLGFASWEARPSGAGHLHQLVVAPEAKGTGVAVRLLAAVKEEAPAGLTLDVNQANGRAVRFYTREGFVVVATGINPTSGLAIWSMAWPDRAEGRMPTRSSP